MLRGFLEGDLDLALAQLVFEQVRCGTLPWHGAPTLPCGAGEAFGAVHELALSGCGLAWVTPEIARAELGPFLEGRPVLMASVRTKGGIKVIISRTDSPSRFVALMISPVGVTSYGIGCGTPIDSAPEVKRGSAARQ